MPLSPSRKSTPLVGALAPPFMLPNPADGSTVQLDDYAGRDVLLVFLRGTWCPFCRSQLQLLTEAHPQLVQANIAVTGVVCQSAASVQRYISENALPFPLLADAQRSVAKAYGAHYWVSWEGINLANPSLFVIDRSGIVTFEYVGRSMRDLPLQRVLRQFLAYLTPNDEKRNN